MVDVQPIGRPEGQRQHQRADGEDDKHGADVVDLAAAADAKIGHLHADHEERENRGRQVDVEDPAPAGDVHAENIGRAVVGEEAADDGADDAGETEDGAEQAGILAALARREEVGDGGEGGGEQRAAANALDAAEDDQLHHAVADDRQVAKFAGEAAQP